MGQNAVEASGLVQDAADVDEFRGVGVEAAAVAVAVDLYLRRDGETGFAGSVGDEGGLFAAVEQDAQGDAAAQEGDDAGQLVRVDADGVRDVGVAAVGERLGLGEGGDGDRAGGVVVHQGGDVEALGRLHVRPQGDPKSVGPPPQSLDVAQGLVHVDDGEGGVRVGQRRRCSLGQGGVHRVMSIFLRRARPR